MTQIAAIATALLQGEVISIKTAFNQFGCTNAPREIGRAIERKFGVTVSRVPRKFKSRYGNKIGIYYEYRLNAAEHNLEGIEKMWEYCAKNGMPARPVKKITAPALNQAQLF